MFRSSSLIIRRVVASTRVVHLSTLRAVAVQRTALSPYTAENRHQPHININPTRCASTTAIVDHDKLDQIPVGKMDREEWNAVLKTISELTATTESESDDKQTTANQIITAITTYERLLEECRYMFQNSTYQQQPSQSSSQDKSPTTSNEAEVIDLQQHVLGSNITSDIVQKWFQKHKSYYDNEIPTETTDVQNFLLSPQQMYEWLEHIRTSFASDDRFSVLDEQSYRLVLTALSLQQSDTETSSIEYAAGILHTFIEAYKSNESTLLHQDWFMIVIDMCVKSKQFDLADQVLEEAGNVYYTADDDERQLPFCTARMYERLMAGYVLQGHYKDARLLFDRFLTIPELKPTLDICRLLMKMIKDDPYDNTTETAHKADALLMKMIHGAETLGWNTYPTIEFVNEVAYCWRYSKDYGRRAKLDVLLDIADMLPWQSELEDYCKIYDHTIFCWSLSRTRGDHRYLRALYERLVRNIGDENLIPIDIRARCILSVLITSSKSKDRDAHVKVREIFDKYLLLKESNIDIEPLLPARKVYSAMLHAYGKAGRAEEADTILAMMIDDYVSGNKGAFPSAQNFAHVALAWKNSRRQAAATKIRNLFQLMVKLRTNEAFTELDHPDSTMYEILLHSFAGSKDVNLALEGDRYFQELLDLSLSGNKLHQPQLTTFYHAMRLWASIDDPLAVKHATRIMEDMISQIENLPFDNTKYITPVAVYRVYRDLVKGSTFTPERTKYRLLARYRDVIQQIEKQQQQQQY